MTRRGHEVVGLPEGYEPPSWWMPSVWIVDMDNVIVGKWSLYDRIDVEEELKAQEADLNELKDIFE